MIRKSSLAILLVILLAGCKAKKEIAETQKITTIQETRSETGKQVCMDANDNIWIEITDVIVKKNALKYAEDFKVFRVDAFRLQQTFEKHIKEHSNFELSVPVYRHNSIECIAFNMLDSETISRETQKRMGVYSFKGEGITNPNTTARIDFTATVGLRTYVQMEEETYLLEPIRINNQRYYISFNKKNTSRIKEQFELTD